MLEVQDLLVVVCRDKEIFEIKLETHIKFKIMFKTITFSDGKPMPELSLKRLKTLGFHELLMFHLNLIKCHNYRKIKLVNNYKVVLFCTIKNLFFYWARKSLC